MDLADIDIMMGTFTKSFGACGGYIAGNHVRRREEEEEDGGEQREGGKQGWSSSKELLRLLSLAGFRPKWCSCKTKHCKF